MADGIADRGPQLLGVNIAFLTTAVIASLLRCYVRSRVVKAWGVDDWLMSVASIFFVLYCISSIIGIHYGTGRHHADLAPADIQIAKMHWWRCYLFYCITMISSKLSIGWFLLRIAYQRSHRMIIYISSLLTGVTGLVFFLVTILQCSPVEYFWNQYDGQVGHCMNIDIVIGLAFVYSGINVFVDFSFALLPAFLVWGLKLDKKTKVATIPLLTMGCVASGAVVARLAYIMKLRDPDFLWATLDIAIWSSIEQGLTITAGSLAALRPLMRRIMQRFGWSRPSEINYGTDNAASRRKENGSNANTLNPSNFELMPSPTSPYAGAYATAGREKEAPYPPAYSPGDTARMKATATSRADSQEGLWADRTSSESLHEIEAGVVVTKSWRITVGRERG